MFAFRSMEERVILDTDFLRWLNVQKTAQVHDLYRVKYHTNGTADVYLLMAKRPEDSAGVQFISGKVPLVQLQTPIY